MDIQIGKWYTLRRIMVWADEWVVYQHIRYKGSEAIYRGNSESDAVEALLNG